MKNTWSQFIFVQCIVQSWTITPENNTINNKHKFFVNLLAFELLEVKQKNPVIIIKPGTAIL
ncbi:MAG: hypothetical protein LBS95_00815 [Mycoplasmataceae bacterium]|nr:hypothetical protein [Mycoplasmataceae bacterium]